MMRDITIAKDNLSIANASGFNLLRTAWIDLGWYNDESSRFSGAAIEEIFEELTAPGALGDPEKTDFMLSTLQTIENTQVDQQCTLKISFKSYFTDKNGHFVVDISNGGSLALALRDYIEKRGLTPREQIERLYLIKGLRRVLGDIDIRVELSAALLQRAVFRVLKIFPLIDKTGDGEETRYAIRFKLQLESGDFYEVQDKDFAADRGYLLINNTYILLDADTIEAVLRQRKLKNLTKPETILAARKPGFVLFPPGTNTEKFDLSEYDARVAGFEELERVELNEITSTGIEWYQECDVENVRIPVRNTQGEVSYIVMQLLELERLVKLMEARIASGPFGPDGYPLPIEDKNGNLLQVNEQILNYLKTFLQMLLREPAGRTMESRGGRGKAVAVIKPDIDRPKNPELTSDIWLTKAEVSRFLKPGIQIEEHQLEGVNWLLSSFFSQNGGVLLCDDMGLGKTLQLILFFTILRNLDHIQKLAIFRQLVDAKKPSLVVAPLVLLENWQNEIGKFIAEDCQFPTYKLHGSGLNAVKDANGRLKDNWWYRYHLILTNYSTFGRYQIDLLRYPFLVTFFDESQNVKNPDIAQSRAARGVNSDFVVCATGTPVEIRLRDLWSQIDTLKRRPQHPLGPSDKFKQDYEEDPTGPDKIRSVIRMNERSGLVLRREKSLLRKKGVLPNKIIHPSLLAPMTPDQEVQESAIVKTYKGNTLKILQNLQKLYQHPYLLAKNITDYSVQSAIADSPKLEVTLKVLEEIKSKNEKVLIFTLWIGMQSILKKVLGEMYGREVDVINGDVNSKGQSSHGGALGIIKSFSEVNGFNVLILSPLAAGTGLNITAANHVIHYGRWWNPAKEDQSTDRAYRIGQTKDVNVYYPVLTTSNGPGFDKKLDERVQSLRQMANNILTPINNLDAELDFAEMAVRQHEN
ncbi:MAG: DEAD/DEAH box helicase [Bdellovibrionales bacterium]|nr:DEAD/DEAH box helicase [Bdellovibrionales bacterium]